MSDAVAQLITAFTSLPPTERYSVILELARLSEDDAGPITDGDLVANGAELFLMYDREEANDGATKSR